MKKAKAPYRDRVIRSAATTPISHLTPAESRLVEIVSRLGPASYLGLAWSEIVGSAFQAGDKITPAVHRRSLDMAIQAAAHLDDQLQRFRESLEAEGNKQAEAEREDALLDKAGVVRG